MRIECEEGIFSYESLRAQTDKCKDVLHSLGIWGHETVAIINDKNYMDFFLTCVLSECNSIIMYLDSSSSSFMLEKILVAYQPDYIIAYKNFSWDGNYIKKPDLKLFNKSFFIYCIKNSWNMWRDINSNTVYKGSFIFFTSGTSKIPRAVIRTRSNIMHDALNNINTFSITCNDIVICAVAFNHVYGFGSGVIPYLFSGAKIIFVNPFITSKKLADILTQKQATVFVGLPIHYKMLLESNIRKFNIRLALSAGSSLASELNNDFYKKYRICINNMYGMSETGAISTYYKIQTRNYNDNCGTPLNGVKVKCIRPSEHDKYGIIRVYSAAVSEGYIIPFDGGIKNIKDHKGWFETNDIGYIDSYNCIHIQGRIENIFNISGKKVNSKIIEDVIEGFKDIEESAVVGESDKLKNTILIAYVVQKNELILDELKSYLHSKLPSYCIPKEYYIIEKMPKTKNGKILKHKLRQHLIQCEEK